jgi:hypothetical protein
MTCWDWLTLAIVVEELGRSTKQKPTDALRTQISGAQKSGLCSWSLTSDWFRPHHFYGMAVDVIAQNLLPQKVEAAITYEARSRQNESLTLSFPLDEVLVCLDWIDEHPRKRRIHRKWAPARRVRL